MRYITILLIIIISLFTINLAQDSNHGHNTSERSTEHNPDTHSDEHKTDKHSEEHNAEVHAEEQNHHGHSETNSTEEPVNDTHGNEHHSEDSETEHANTTETEEIQHSDAEGESHSEHTTHADSHAETQSKTQSDSHSEHSTMAESTDTNHADNGHDSHHSHSETSDASKPNANNVILGETMLSLYPLLSPQGDFQVVVKADKAGYTSSVKFEDTNLKTVFDESGITTIDLGVIKQGTYYFIFRDSNAEVTTPLSVYKAFTPSGKAFTTIFAPSPSLSSRGQSEVFVYNIAEGENQHELISVNYSMAGMQHAMDDTITPLAHEHFDSLKSSIAELEASNTAILDTAMSNRSTLSFAMAGTWEFSLMVAGETLTFDIVMLDQ